MEKRVLLWGVGGSNVLEFGIALLNKSEALIYVYK